MTSSKNLCSGYATRCLATRGCQRDRASYPTYTPLRLLSTELALTLASSPTLTRLDYCNSLLHDSHINSIQTLQRVQNNAPNDFSAGIEAVPRTPAAAPAPLAAGLLQNPLQAG